MKDYESLPFIPVKKGEGVYLEDFDGNRYIDAISSWWVNLFGHSNPYINQKIKEQLDSLEHVIFAGFTHKPAVDLAQRLIRLTPKGLDKIFFADNGSSAVEVSLKIAFQYFKNKGEVKDIFISLQNSYHGETIGALSVGDVGLYKEVFKEILIQSVQVKSPSLVSEDEALNSLKDKLEEYRGRVSAFIIEPLVQCAGSMAMYDPSYIKEAKKLCEKYGVFLICDEIAVGFGRVGTMFAFEQAGIVPDFLCLSKGITGGYLPLSVVMMSDEVYGAFYCDYGSGKSFLHSHSYSGNALACAAANASLDLFESENIIQKNQKLISHIQKKLQRFLELEDVKEVRQRGMIAAVELKGYDVKERTGLKIYQYALKNGVLLRPLGNVIYFMPPYIITTKEIDLMMDTAYEAIVNLRFASDFLG
jgi:adenosylmethionine-8-amino-7-oxononanoate aminotransferase